MNKMFKDYVLKPLMMLAVAIPAFAAFNVSHAEASSKRAASAAQELFR